MSEKRQTIQFQGEDVLADQLDFEATKEDWNVYTVEDGASIKMKNVVVNVFKLVDKKKDDGSPVYVVMGNALLATERPSVLDAGQQE